MGETTLTLYDSLNECNFLTCLITIEHDADRAQAFMRRFEAYRKHGACGVTIHHGDATRVLSEMSPGQADLIFLDDDHEIHHVRAEIPLALRALRPRGLLCMHDVMGTLALSEAVKDWHGVSLDLPRLHASGGLGIIVKEG